MRRNLPNFRETDWGDSSNIDDEGSISHDEVNALTSASRGPDSYPLQLRNVSDETTRDEGVDRLPSESSSTDELPRSIFEQVQQWYNSHDGQLPCVRSGRAYTLQIKQSKESNSKSNTAVEWLHESGERLTVEWYKLPESARKFYSCKAGLVVVRGKVSLEPRVVRYYATGKHLSHIAALRGIGTHATTFKVWLGVDGDEDGFEETPSVYKVQAPALQKTAARKSSTRGPPTANPRAIRTSTRSKKQNFEGDGTSSRRHPRSAHNRTAAERNPVRFGEKPALAIPSPRSPRTRTRKRDDQNGIRTEQSGAAGGGIEVALPQKRTRRASNIKGKEKPHAPATRIPDAKVLHDFIVNNTTMVFHAAIGTETRVLPLSACNSLGKFFQQVIAAKTCFNAEFRVVAARISEEIEVPLVQHIEEDFQKFMAALEDAPLWEVDDMGAIRENCTIEVSEMV